MNHWNVQPDVLVTAKGITSAYVPLGTVRYDGRIASYFDDHYFAHGHTYEAHPMTLARHRYHSRDAKAEPNRTVAVMGRYLGGKAHEFD